MLLNVRVIPKASRNRVKEETGRLKIYLTRPAQDNLANIQLIEVLSEYLHTRKALIRIIKGHKSRDKIVEIA